MLLRLRRGQLSGSLLRRFSLTNPFEAPPVLFFTPSASRSSLPAVNASNGGRSFSYDSGGSSKGKKDAGEGRSEPPGTAAAAPGAGAKGKAGTEAGRKAANSNAARETVGEEGRVGRTGNRRSRRAAARAVRDNLPHQRMGAKDAQLPFTPLLPDHLGHAHPNLLLRDAFFSAGRPLLEVEVPERFRRTPPRVDDDQPSSTSEDGADLVSVTASDIPFPDMPLSDASNTGAPSDPAFKAPQTFPSLDQPKDVDLEGLEEEVFGPSDPHAGYLITEPEGVDPAWPQGVTRYLAGCEMLVSPKPSMEEVIEAEDLRAAEEEARRRGREGEWDEETVKKAAFLAPFGLHPPIAARAGPLAPMKEASRVYDSSLESTLAHRVMNHHSNTDPSRMTVVPSLPGLDQSPHSLTITAARYLHSGLMTHHYSGALEWDAVARDMDEAQRTLVGHPNTSDSSRLPGVTGAVVHVPGRRRARRLPTSESASNPLAQISVLRNLRDALRSQDAPGMQDLIKYTHSEGPDGSAGVMVEIDLRAFEQRRRIAAAGEAENGAELGKGAVGAWVRGRGPRLLRPRWVWMASVFRKKKRKMNVHKYKKRRKARRVLKKRLGK